MNKRSVLDEGLDTLVKVFQEAMTRPGGPGAMLCEGEIKRGARIVPLGTKKPFRFTEDDWRRGVISLKGDEVRIVAIEARNPGHGALKRLLRSITKAGLKPVIVAAMFDMPAILRHWGWSVTSEPDDGFGRVDVWRPSGQGLAVDGDAAIHSGR
jgi:hypothetical protein